MAVIRQTRVYDLRQGDEFSFDADIYKSTRYTIDEITPDHRSRPFNHLVTKIVTTRKNVAQVRLDFDVWEISDNQTLVWVIG